ncbi:MAG: RNA polymerase sigma-70 factor [Rhodothermales bacterium]
MLSSQTESDLCRRLQASDREAFETAFKLLRGGLIRYVRSIVSDDEVAHDLVQDVFVSLWGLRSTLDPARSLKAYVYTMARNRAYRYLRDERVHRQKHAIIKEASSAFVSDQEWPNAHIDASALKQKLRAWIAELPERQREAISLSRYHGLSHREVADVMGVSPRTVNNHIMRALEHLHHRVQTYEPSFLVS